MRAAVLVLLATALAEPAYAQPGDHIRAGDVEVVPSVGLGLFYQTNVYRSESASTPAASLGVSPGLAVTAAGDDHEFSADGEWILQKYLFVGDVPGSTLTTGDRISSLDRFDQFHLGAGADLFKKNQVGLRLSDAMTLHDWQVDAEAAAVPYTTQYRNALAAGLRVNPGPALEIVPGFAWTYDHFSTPDFTEGHTSGERSLNSRNSLGPRLDAKWAFLPRTALVAHVTWDHNDWATNSIPSIASAFGNEIDIPNSDFVRFKAGIDGRFTERLFLQALLGYGVGLFNVNSVDNPTGQGDIAQNVSGVDGLLATAQLKYQITPRTDQTPGSALLVGYVKDFRSSFFTNYIAVNQLFAQFSGRFDVFEPSIRYELRFENYGGEIDRNDIVNRIIGSVGWNATDYAKLSGGLSWQQRASQDPLVEFDNVALQLDFRFEY